MHNLSYSILLIQYLENVSTVTENEGSARCGRTGPVNGTAGIFIAAVVGVACAAGTVHADSNPDRVVSLPGDLVEFTRHCADEPRHRVQAYALFVSPTGDARALFQVQVGFAAYEKTIQVFSKLQGLALDAGVAWGERSFALVLAAQNASGQTVVSPALSTWIDHAGWRQDAPAAVNQFVTTATGRTNWITFVEPDEAVTEDEVEGYRSMEPMHIAVNDLALRDKNETIAMLVILRDLDNSGEILMLGPSIRIPERVWTKKPPDHEPHGQAQSWDLFPVGRFLNWSYRAWKYRKCIDERKAAKRFVMSDKSRVELIPSP